MIKKIPRRHQILYHLLAILVIIATVPLLISAYTLIRINQNVLENDLLLLHTQLATDAANQISNLMARIFDELEVMARAQLLSVPLKAGERERLLFFFLEQYPSILKFSLMDREGKEIASVYRADRVAPSFTEGNPLKEDLFKEAIQGKRSLSPTFIAASPKTPCLLAYQPIKDESGETLGILSALITLEEINDLISRIRVRRQGHAYLVNNQGKLIAHPNRVKVLQEEDMKEVEIVRNYLLLGKTGGTIPFRDKNDREMLGAYATVKQLGWGVVVQEPREDAYLSVDEMKRQTIIWGLVAAILATAVGIGFARHLSNPIHKFVQGALSIAGGNFGNRIDVRTKNEIGKLAETFNYMTQQLQLYDENMKEMFLSTVRSLAAAIDAKDPYTRGHSERVTQHSLAIAEEMKLGAREREKINIAALLHDVGKIGIDTQILRKPDKLSEEEYALIKQHPVLGANIMAPIKQLREIVPLMRHHHEFYDGTGFPDHIRGEEIPLGARILCLADTFDAMTSDRPYQKAMETDYVLERITSWSGTRFDPKVVNAFLACIQSGRIPRKNG
ncbi:MAG: cache domain-containing protein [candidate division NC10 bacterium]|nr:cache domain-containing protein [candidate division NC10 bacterium]